MTTYHHEHYGYMDLLEVWGGPNGVTFGTFKTLAGGGIIVNLPMSSVIHIH